MYRKVDAEVLGFIDCFTPWTGMKQYLGWFSPYPQPVLCCLGFSAARSLAQFFFISWCAVSYHLPYV
jgi:hypothetical protein